MGSSGQIRPFERLPQNRQRIESMYPFSSFLVIFAPLGLLQHPAKVVRWVDVLERDRTT